LYINRKFFILRGYSSAIMNDMVPSCLWLISIPEPWVKLEDKLKYLIEKFEDTLTDLFSIERNILRLFCGEKEKTEENLTLPSKEMACATC